MKRLLVPALTLVALLGFSSPGVAQHNRAQKDPPKSVEAIQRAKEWSFAHRYFCWDNEGTGFWSGSSVPDPEYFCVGPYARRPDSEPMTGKVTAVDPKLKTFTIMIEGTNQRRFQKETVSNSAGRLKALPKIGAIIDLIENPARFNYPSCEDCNGECPGVCFLGGNGCRCYLFHLRTK